MKKINLALISDSVFVTLCAFLIIFAAIRFYFKSAVWALVIAALCALILGVAAFISMYRKRKKKLAANANQREKKTLALHLSVSSEKYVTDLFSKALGGEYAAANRIEDDENAYFFYFTLSPLSPDDVAKTVKFSSQKNKIIYCCFAGEDALSLAADFKVEIKNVNDVYALLKEKELLPEKYACGEIKKQSVFARVKKRFNRKLCPSLFFCGASLLFFSFFTFYPVYYAASGGVLLALAAASLLFGQSS